MEFTITHRNKKNQLLVSTKSLERFLGQGIFTIIRKRISCHQKIGKDRRLDILDSNLQQAMVPDTCDVIVNRYGTAPIMVFR